MKQVTANDTADELIGKMNGNFTEAGHSVSFAHSQTGADFINSVNTGFGLFAERLSVSDTGNDFLGKLNRNFANLSPVGTDTVSMPMQAGELENGASKEYGSRNSSTGTSNYWKYLHSVSLLEISQCVITDVSLFSDETLTVHYYDSNRKFVGSTGSISSVPSSARYVRFQLSSASAITPRNLTIAISGTASTAKCLPNRSQDGRTYISYEVTKHQRFATDVDYFGGRLYDNGFIYFPQGHDNSEQIDLAVFIQGTSGYPFDRINKTNASYNLAHYDDYYKEPIEFLGSNGFAVCCCSGVTSKYGNSVTNLYFSPLFCESVASMVDWIKANYNVGKIYLFGKSSGGLLSNFPALVEEIGAVCVGSLAPAFCPLGSLCYRSDESCEQVGVPSQPPYHKFDSGMRSWTDNDKATVIANVGKFRKFDALFSTNNISDSDLATIIRDMYTINSYYGNYGRLHNAYNNTSEQGLEFKSLLDSSERTFPVPHMIWVATDDPSVSYNDSVILKDITNRSYSEEMYYITTMASNTGGHHADYYDSRAEQETRDGVTFSKAYWQLVDWFKSNGQKNKTL